MAKFDLAKSAEATAVMKRNFNSDVIESLNELAGLVKKLPESTVKDDLVGNLGKMENAYNTEVLPIIRDIDKVISTQLPELDAKIKQLDLGNVKVQSSSVKATELDNDMLII
ncbi:hypothetical protein D3C81_783630 [compost metagenome]|jgi:hypothetical protein